MGAASSTRADAQASTDDASADETRTSSTEGPRDTASGTIPRSAPAHVEDPTPWELGHPSTLARAGFVPSHARWFRVATKRVVDVLFATCALVLLSPLYLLLAIVTYVSSPGPVFFGHERVGRDGKRFRCWKFRTMEVDAAERLAELLERDPIARAEWETSFKLTDDPRITRFGGVMRSTSLDELPQFWNVLRGHMSVVGPRPIVEAEMAYYGEGIDCYMAVRPGVTGPWQAFGRSTLDYEDRVLLDRKYATSFDLLLDIGIISRTCGAVLKRLGAH